ncbi:hypothetical protein [Streptomyces piniterrae]|uniref:hypothetical protein n=1 Tax=Streptomyces piniterrae TaxID=2571125 RepID=UPI00145DCB3B|nr:hypothetical protein [Streptomyces piniterrae]
MAVPGIPAVFRFPCTPIWNNFLLPLVPLSVLRLSPPGHGLYAWNSNAHATPS